MTGVIIDPRWLTVNVCDMARVVLREGYETDKLPILADALDDAGCDNSDLIYALRTGEYGRYETVDTDLLLKFAGYSVPPELDDYDWKEAFSYAGEPGGCKDSPPSLNAAIPTSGVALTPFSRWDVERIIAKSEGENDGPNWLCCGELRDGRFFALDAGCDYTGWD